MGIIGSMGPRRAEEISSSDLPAEGLVIWPLIGGCSAARRRTVAPLLRLAAEVGQKDIPQVEGQPPPPPTPGFLPLWVMLSGPALVSFPPRFDSRAGRLTLDETFLDWKCTPEPIWLLWLLHDRNTCDISHLSRIDLRVISHPMR